MAGLYYHIPYCHQRCVYCDFYFVTTQKSHAGFIASLRREIEHYAHTYAAREPVETIYFGGGTPSQLLLDEWYDILSAVHDHFDTGAVTEVTAEINPGEVDLDYLRELRRLGVNRLSIGVQSFFADDLKAMNRSHSAEEAEAVLDLARAAGFDNFSIDLILDRKSTRLNSSHVAISYAVFCLKKKKDTQRDTRCAEAQGLVGEV